MGESRSSERREEHPDPRRRRAVIAGLAGTGVGVAALAARLGTSSGGPPPPPTKDRVRRAFDAGGFGNRDESYANAGAAPPAPPPGPTMVFASASEAAANTEVTTPTILATDRPHLHLLRRMTWGPTPELVQEVESRGIDGWLAEQLAPDAIPDPVADQAWAAFPMARMAPAQIQAAIDRHSWPAMTDYGKATLTRQVWSRRQLYEVMVDFWADHLHVTMPDSQVWDTGIAYHDEVIRRHALGSFTDMLLAAMRHPGMLRYLDNANSSKEAVNENLGREILELHTVGVGSGYSEEDVRNSAYILTGRTVGNQESPAPDGTFFYDPGRHWTGPVRVLDFQHENATPEGGLEVGDAYLRYLASHPSTAQVIARKLAVRFVSDVPPQSLVDRLAATYLDHGTAIVPVLDVMLRSREFWAAVGQKTRRPLENLVATMRVLGVQPGPDTAGAVEALYWSANEMGQQPLAWKAPNGYPDVHAAWRSASGLLTAWNRHRALVEGWDEGFAYTPPEQLVAGMPSATVGEHVDSLCRRLCFQTFQPHHRDVLLLFVGAAPETPTADSDLARSPGAVAALVLDSPYFALR
jgi:uncharacterized protein (DUF1800 family)